MNFQQTIDTIIASKIMAREMQRYSQEEGIRIVIDFDQPEQEENRPITQPEEEKIYCVDYNETDNAFMITFCTIGLIGSLAIFFGIGPYLGVDTDFVPALGIWVFIFHMFILYVWIKFRKYYFTDKNHVYTNEPPIFGTSLMLFIWMLTLLLG